ncbi:hypothetical protein BDV24DRAFT_157618 [Aspergillus arachidicola]|uniref:Hydrophobin n=1 Tax=Aspergillus arachidicola TaxID=656916 RepID=A0A2G7G9V6_9EURO|nr:hypothetical protein BDV24DRAFT_157618 [Aspergillus arachidicola]PIG89626.1 hypothetical protein AARAC_008938 [Aspergillus arachidicola]
MKLVFTSFLFVTTVIAVPQNEAGNVCASKQTVVCYGQENGDLITLGNVMPGALGENCAAGKVYCCSYDDVQQSGLVNLDVDSQCTFNRVL